MPKQSPGILIKDPSYTRDTVLVMVISLDTDR